MSFEADVTDRLNAAMGNSHFAKRAYLEWQHDLDKVDGGFVLIIETARTLSLGGGDGWHGFDAKDADLLNRTVQDVVLEHGAIGRIKRIVVH